MSVTDANESAAACSAQPSPPTAEPTSQVRLWNSRMSSEARNADSMGALRASSAWSIVENA